MRKIVVHMQTTLDNRIANGAGMFWEPFPWGEQEQAYINNEFRAADTLVLSRVLYDAIVPWWDAVASSPPGRTQAAGGRNHSAGRWATLGPLADAPGLIDEYLVVVHPAVLTDGPSMVSVGESILEGRDAVIEACDHSSTDLAQVRTEFVRFRSIGPATAFDAGRPLHQVPAP